MTKMIGGQISRRTLLRGGGMLMGLPLLEAMLPFSALAQSGKAGPPKRLAFLFVPNGINMASWTPATEGAGFALSPTLAPLANVRESVMVLSGLTQKNAFALGDGGGDHARSAAAWLTGCHPRKTSGADIKAGISADQLAARFIGSQTSFPSLEIGCEGSRLAGDCDSGYSCAYSNTISWRGESTPVAKEINPRDVFERLFGSGDDLGANAAARAQRRVDNKSVLDFLMEDANSLKRQLGQHDQRKLDEYFTSVREIEQRLQFVEKSTQAQAAGSQASGGAQGFSVPAGIPEEYSDHVRLMGDMMVLAFQADLTRVCTFMFANEGSNRSYKQINISEGHHELSHHGKVETKLEKIQQINHFHVQQLAYILEKMKSIKEANGTLLDNTLLVYGGGISDGDRHNHNDLPILVAGGKDIVKSGRHIRYDDGTPMTNLFMTVYDRMGIPTEKIGTLGDSNGKLQQLF